MTAVPDAPLQVGAAASSDHGFVYEGVPRACSRSRLVAMFSGGAAPPIEAVWTPTSGGLLQPWEVDFLVAAYRKTKARRYRAGFASIAFNLLLFALFLLPRRLDGGIPIGFLVALALLAGVPAAYLVWSLVRLPARAAKLLQEEIEGQRNAGVLPEGRLRWTWVLLGCLIAISVVQFVVGLPRSILAAGLVKDAARGGETWRVLTAAYLHGGLMHIFFNGSALVNLGAAIEMLGHRAHLAIVFFVSALASGVASLYLMPESTSVGASGGLMGLLGFLVVLGLRRKRRLPKSFLRSLGTSILLMAAVGYLARDMIDNAAHGGGLAAGLLLGVLLVRRGDDALPVVPSRAVRDLGTVAAIAILLGAALTVTKLLTP